MVNHHFAPAFGEYVFLIFQQPQANQSLHCQLWGQCQKGMGPIDFSGNKSLTFVWLLRNFREVSSIRTWEFSGQFGIFLERNNQKEMRMHRKEVFYSRAEWFSPSTCGKVKGFMLMFIFYPKTWVRWIPILLIMCCNWIELTHYIAPSFDRKMFGTCFNLQAMAIVNHVSCLQIFFQYPIVHMLASEPIIVQLSQ